ncbi:MAG TPA: glycosyltransferase family 4 protein [Aestuariivirga sp.]|nr:glycosyltransferase family 4 protein [Aestuariivirga sp.]
MTAKPTVIILQNDIMAYRKPLYNGLAEFYRVVVVHAGKMSRTAQDSYEEVILARRTLGPFQFLRGLRKHLAHETPVAVVGMFDLRWPQYLTRWGAVKTARFLLWGHRYSGRRLANWARDRIMALADGLILYGTEDLAALRARGFPGDRIFFAHNTMAIDNHRDMSGEEKSSFLYVGRLQERKAIDRFMAGFAAIRNDLPPAARFEIVGDGEARAALENAAVRLGIADRVVFHGKILDDDRLRTIFGRAHAYVSDNVGLAVLHSFAYGVPIITVAPGALVRTNFRHGPEYQNLRHGENSLICDGDAAIADAMRRMVREPEFGRRLGHDGYRLYAGERLMEHMVAGFRQAVSGCR